MLDALGCRDQLLTGGIEAQPLREAVEQVRTAKSGLERRQSASDGGLAEPERPPGGTHRTFTGDGEEHPNITPIHGPSTQSWRTARRLMPRLARRNRQSVESSHDIFLHTEAQRVLGHELNRATKTFQWSPKTEITSIKLRRYDPPPRCGSLDEWREQCKAERRASSISTLKSRN
jgi:hypothetical protein